jgi:stage II sporulation protein GA (sporulation sigma-E factor processing peptidase)
METVYIDLYLIVNVSMDILCLMIGGAMLHRRLKRWRALLGAVFGGVYAVAALLLGWDGFWGVIPDVCAVVVMCMIAFGRQKRSYLSLLRTAAVVWVCSMLLGGIMTALYALLNRLNLPLDALQGDGLSAWTFVLVSAVAGLLTVKSGRWFGLSGKAKTATVEVELYGQRTVLRAMVDTGNLLCDPVSGRSVIVAELDALAPLLPPALVRACESGDFSAYLSSHERAKRIRLIPAGSVGGDALLLAIVPDRVRLTVGNESFVSNHLIAPKHLHLSDFDALIGL